MSSRSSKSDKRNILDRFFTSNDSVGDNEYANPEEEKENLIKTKTTRFVAFSGSDDLPVGFDPFVSSCSSSASSSNKSQSYSEKPSYSSKTVKTKTSPSSECYESNRSSSSGTVSQVSGSFGDSNTKKSKDDCSYSEDKHHRRRRRSKKKKNSNWWVWIIVVILFVILLAIAGTYFSKKDKGANGKTYGGIAFVVFLLLVAAIIWAVWRD